MVKKLFLIRHAEAESGSSEKKDFYRDLTNKGTRDSARLGKYLMMNNFVPDLIVASPAVRARQTAELIADQVGYGLDRIVLHEDLYETSVRVLLEHINKLNDKGKRVFLINHNPSITYLAEYLTSADVGNLSPASMVVATMENASWREFSQGSADLALQLSPDNLD